MLENIHIRDQILFFLGSTGFLSGIFLTNIFHESILYVLLVGIVFWVQIYALYRNKKWHTILFLVFFILGSFLSLVKSQEIYRYEGILEEKTSFFTKEVLITATLTEKISESDKGAKYILRNMTIDGNIIPDNLGILATFPTARNMESDHIVSFTGKIRKPVGTENFDYRTYLLLDDVYATTSVSMSAKIGVKPSSVFTLTIRRIRSVLLSTISQIYPGESAKLLSGILIGEKSDISPETKTSFNNAGLTHIIAVSGFNITIILIFLSFLFRSFPSYIKVVLAIISVGFFTLLVGPQISVLRASVFGLIAYTILLSGKKIRAFSVLIGVAIFFVALNPLILNSDVSFHLSFLAVFGLLFFGDFFNRLFRWFPSWFGLRESLSMCFAAMVFTLPITMVNFGQISLVAPLANLLVVPSIPLIMLSWFVSMVIYAFSHSVWIFVGFPTWVGLEYILKATAYFWNLPHATIPMDLWIYAPLFKVLYFMIVGFLVIWFRKKEDITYRV